MASSFQSVVERVRSEGLIAIAREDFRVEELCDIADALKAASASVMEVTLDSARALEAIATQRERCGTTMSVVG